MPLRPVSGTAREVHAELCDWVLAGGEPIVVRTSGSTGRPKDVRLSHTAVLASARAALERLGGPGGWVSALPPTAVGGLQVLVRSVLAGVEPQYVDPGASGRAVEAAISALPGPRRYASLVPTQLFRLIEAGQAGVLAPLDAVLLGGAAAPERLLERARAARVTVVRTYGMSETSGGCVYDGVPLDGVRMRIGPGGLVELAGDVLFDGYGDEPRDGDWFRTGDVGAIEHGVLRVLGRADDMVVSGGVNVALPVVEALAREVAGVRDAAVVAVPDDEWGQKVIAFVVGPVEAGAVREQIAGIARTRDLPRAFAPREARVVAELPLLPGGKVDRQALIGRALRAPR